MAIRRRRRVIVTAGPTREHIDPVRYISNESSGKMGFAIARAAQARGDQVTLIAGPVDLETPPGLLRVDVISARDMQKAVREAFDQADALFMCAAVGDWRPRRRLAGKWRKKDHSEDSASLELVANPDIVAQVARTKGERLVVAFALETTSLSAAASLRRARAKMKRKRTDYIVLNDASALSADRASVTILGRDGSCRRLSRRAKEKIAEVLVDLDGLD
ncbi:MAG: phosphopantothenoylcysteine decarboxylase [bacterium]|jgi:phosphopantothenoylcysteine decarboxylase/phosphopantothenate--cysteine ligase|nr:phosphopantothenoylcysteine decarboxylase [Planctomycetota bacterium]HIL52552.1 phosphopantothenoylcysteine decarboxylase [Planctomycetota bacterium]